MGKSPSRAQLLVGGIDMLRYFISPGAYSYYRTKGIRFGSFQTHGTLGASSRRWRPA